MEDNLNCQVSPPPPPRALVNYNQNHKQAD